MFHMCVINSSSRENNTYSYWVQSARKGHFAIKDNTWNISFQYALSVCSILNVFRYREEYQRQNKEGEKGEG